MSMNIDKLVATYVGLRDEKAAIKAEMEKQTGMITEVMDKIEAKLLKHFNETGQESAATAHGTAYKSQRTSVTVADWDRTLPWIRDNGLWHMLDRRVNKTAVEEYRDQHKEFPPGLNVRIETTINIRRS